MRIPKKLLKLKSYFPLNSQNVKLFYKGIIKITIL